MRLGRRIVRGWGRRGVPVGRQGWPEGKARWMAMVALDEEDELPFLFHF
jgi:hypothetical protein